MGVSGMVSAAGHNACAAVIDRQGLCMRRWQTRLAAGAAGVGVIGHEGHHRDLPGPLDSGPKGALMLGTHTGAASGLNLGSL